MVKNIWCLRKGNQTIFTQRYEIAEEAKHAGYIVSIVHQKSHIFRSKYPNF